MIEIDVPGYKKLQIRYLVLDFNGTLAVDGHLLPGVRNALNALADDLEIHVITADTFGKSAAQLKGVRCKLSVLPAGEQDKAKLEYVKQLGAGHTVCIGNGRNDRQMLSAALLGLAVILGEGAAGETLMAADAVFTDILSALEFLQCPLRITATFRS
ncbi:MAG: ATPase P [Desulfococcaceae bacterium]|jgi:soluble P-type ATPase|nr:ATPase P [Desulfococcaceae bacterium]